MGDRLNNKVCFIGGAGHSGSTLLGLILGSHSSGFYAGEAAKTRYLHDNGKPLRKRSCKFCGTDCPVWANFYPQPEPDLYEQLAHHVQRSFVIDSTKNVDWLLCQWQRLCAVGVNVFFIFLQRDGRAVFNSRLRKYKERSPHDLIEQWRTQIYQTQEFYTVFSGKKRVLRYEKLATEPEATLRDLCDWLDLTYEPPMLDYTHYPHHVLGGNNGTQSLVAQAQNLKNFGQQFGAEVASRHHHYYRDHDREIHLDLRWRSELSLDHQKLFQTLAGLDNQPMQWDV